MNFFSKSLRVSATVVTSALLATAFGLDATADQPPVATIQRLNAGDRACYVELTAANGETSTEFADFEICEQDLVGKRVRLTYESGNILAESCQGNPDCGQSETVMLITQVEVLSPINAPPVNAPPVNAPPANAPATTVQTLADGNYRYWSGTPSQAIISDNTLMDDGGTVFRFRKQGNMVTGLFSYVDGEAICVQGQVNGNTVSGTAVQTLQGASVLSRGESFATFGSSEALAVRRGRQVNRQVVRYDSALLNLAGLNRINAGSVLPPSGCQV